jgi:serine/threonine protein kinase
MSEEQDGGKMKELNLINSGAFGCIYRPSLTCDGNIGSEKYITKIQKNERTISNEIRISEKIRKLRGYARFFAPILKFCNVQIKKDRLDDLNKCEVFRDETKEQILSKSYVSMKTRYVGDNDLMKYIFSSTNINIFLKELWRTHLHLLKGIQKLFANKILHHDLKYNNIIFDSKMNVPIIIDFGQSWSIDEMNTESKISTIFFVFDQYDYWTIDILICSYIFQKIGYKEAHAVLVTEAEMNYIYDVFVYGRTPVYDQTNLYSKQVVSDVFRYNILQNPGKMLKFKEVFDSYVEQFIGKKTWWEMYQDLIQYTKSWDLYSISVIYMNLLDDAFLSNPEMYNNLMIISNGKLGRYIELIESVLYCRPNERPTIDFVIKQLEQIVKL